MVQESRLVITIDSRNALRNAEALGRELDNIERRGNFATRSIDSMSVAVRNLAGYMMGIVTVGTAIAKMDAYTGLNNRLKLVTASQTELNQALKDTFAIAQATGQSWDSTAQVYQRFADNAKRLGITLKQTASLTETVAKAISISGGSAASAEAALMQFGQSLASGVFRGEEFNSVAEQAPGLLKAIASGLNVNIGELRSMAKEGKLTADVLVTSLKKAKVSVDELFNKTDFTIANSFTQLSNAVTKFVGEAGKGSGASQAISASLKGLADNLETVTNIAMIGGAYWAGTYIPTIYKAVVASGAKVKALYEEIQVTNAAIIQTQRKAQAEYNAAQAEMSAARAAVLAAEMEVNANRAVIQSEVQRIQASIAATNAEKAQEAQRLKSQITDQGRAMSISRMATLQQTQALMTAELTVLEQRLASTTVASSAAYTTARTAQTAATQRLTLATAELNVASSLTTRSAFGLLGALGGPVGLGLAVAGVAASMLLLRDNTDKATKSLNENGLAVADIVDKYNQLDEVQKRTQLRAETKSLKELTDDYKDAGNKLFEYTVNIERYGYVSAEASERIGDLVLEYQKGKITASDLATQVNSLSGVSAKAKAKIDEQAGAVSKLKDELSKQKNIVEAMISQAGRSTQATEAETKALNEKRIAHEKLINAQKNSLNENLKNQYLINNINRNGSNQYAVDFANFMVGFRENNKIPFDENLSKEVLKVAHEQFLLEQKRKNLIDGIKDSEKDRTKELEKQQKILTVNSKVQANATKFGFGGIESKYGLPSGMLSALHMIESRGNANAYNKETGATGGFQFLKGTADQYKVKNRNDLAQSAEGAGKYMAHLLDLFKGDLEKAVRAYHAGEGNVMKGKNIGKNNNQYWKDFQGYMAGLNGYKSGDITSKDFEKLLEESAKLAEQQAQSRIQLEQAVADRITQIRNDLAEKIKEIDKAGYSDADAKKLKAQYQERADNEIAITQQATKTKLDDYKAFQKSEEQLLRDSFARRQFDARHDLEMTKDQREEAVELLGKQLKEEEALLALAKEQRLFQARQFLLAETDAMRERYRLEREEIALNTQKTMEERAKLIQFSKSAQEKELTDRIKSSVLEMSRIRSEMRGGSAMGDLDRAKFSNLSANQNMFDSANAGVDFNQDSQVEGLQKQLDQKLITQQQFEDQQTAIIQASLEQRKEIYDEFYSNQIEIENDYWNKTKAYQLSMASDVFGGLAGVMLNFVDESSSSYRTLVSIQKAANLASVLMNSVTAISAAWASAPFPYNLPAVTMATLETGALQATLSAFSPQGFADGGYTGNGLKHTPAGIVHKGEVVWSQEDINRWGGVGVVESMRQSSPRGYSDGGYVTPNFNESRTVDAIQRQQRQTNLINDSVSQRNAAARNSQASTPSVIDNQLNVAIYDDREDIYEQMASAKGEKVWLYHYKRNKSKVS